MDIVDHRFTTADLVAGHPVLDFVNTATGRDETPRDWLGDYAGFVGWAQLAGVVTAGEATQLRALDRDEPRRGADALARLRDAREALYETMHAIARDRRPPAASLAAIDAEAKRALRHATLAWHAGNASPQWRIDGSGIDLPRDRLGWAALQLLGDASLARVRQCDGTNCAWVFLDTSKNGRRRWCDMATCGNVAKARRHYARLREG